MSRIIVGIIGKAGAGKDTIGEFLIEHYAFKNISLADRLKACVQVMFMVDDYTMHNRDAREKPLKDFPEWSVRKLLQFVGTELFRNNFDQDIWVKLLKKQIRESESNLIVVTDVRFPNEIEGIMEMSNSEDVEVYFIKVFRDGKDGHDVGIDNHASEKYDLDGDYIINNNGTILELYDKVSRIINSIYKNN